jgi:hypothetical protein
VVYVSTNAASPEPRTAISTVNTPKQMNHVRSSRVASSGLHVLERQYSAASFHDGFVRRRKWFRPPLWNAVRGELIQVRLRARRTGGERQADGAPVCAGPARNLPAAFRLTHRTVAGAIPSLSTSRSGTRPRRLNHCEAAFSVEKPTTATRGGQIRSARPKRAILARIGS